jgi:hypothetical protein
MQSNRFDITDLPGILAIAIREHPGSYVVPPAFLSNGPLSSENNHLRMGERAAF